MGDPSNGLKGQWGVKEPGAPPSDKQAQDFKAAFNPVNSQITTALEYTVQYSEESKHKAVGGKQSKLVESYTMLLAHIDPTNPSVSAGAIQGVLGDGSALSQEAQTLKKNTETDYQAWKKQFPFYEKAESKVEELDIWDATMAAPLVALLAKVVEHETARRWADANSELLKLEQAMSQPYAEYELQSAAKDNYDVERPSFDNLFQSTAEHPRPSPELSTLRNAIETKITAMGTAVEGKDYLTAEETLEEANNDLIFLQTATEEHEKAEKDYNERLTKLDTRNTALQERTDALSDHGVKQLASLVTEANARAPMETSFAGNDFKAALGHLEGLEGKQDAWDAKLTEIENSLEEKRRRLAEIQSELPKLLPEKDKIENEIVEYERLAGNSKGRVERAEKKEFDNPGEGPNPSGNPGPEILLRQRELGRLRSERDERVKHLSKLKAKLKLILARIEGLLEEQERLKGEIRLAR